jgi:hypothetical protein
MHTCIDRYIHTYTHIHKSCSIYRPAPPLARLPHPRRGGGQAPPSPARGAGCREDGARERTQGPVLAATAAPGVWGLPRCSFCDDFLHSCISGKSPSGTGRKGRETERKARADGGRNAEIAGAGVLPPCISDRRKSFESCAIYARFPCVGALLMCVRARVCVCVCVCGRLDLLTALKSDSCLPRSLLCVEVCA